MLLPPRHIVVVTVSPRATTAKLRCLPRNFPVCPLARGRDEGEVSSPLNRLGHLALLGGAWMSGHVYVAFARSM